ncbi:MAG TPA: hypothetical protein VF145_01080 [Chitinophagaceae bacterium]
MDYTAITNEPGLIALFVIPLIWVVISYLTYRVGWRDMQMAYPAEPGTVTKRLGIVSGVIGESTYTNALVLRYNENGLQLRPVIFFRLFQKPVFFPWKDIREGKHTGYLLGQRKELVLGQPEQGRLVIRPSMFAEFETYLTMYAIPNHRTHRQSTPV